MRQSGSCNDGDKVRRNSLTRLGGWIVAGCVSRTAVHRATIAVGRGEVAVQFIHTEHGEPSSHRVKQDGINVCQIDRSRLVVI